MATITNIVEQLAAITGPEHVRPGNPTEVWPVNTQQVSEILRFANENGLTVNPAGGKTKQSWGNQTQTSIRLNLTRLNRVIEHPWQDLTCTVQAGCTWRQLQQTVAKQGQFVALDPLWPERATVGGILATNDSGTLRHRYGSLRDLIIGMTLVLADGTIARSGGKVVKNVAGYDLCKLITGSLGTLAVITEATFRLHPLPQHLQTFTVHAPLAAQLGPLMANIRSSHLLTQALQLRGNSYGFHLDIQLSAHPEAHQNEILQRMTKSAGLKLEPASDEVWQAREKHCADDESFKVKMTMLPTDILEFSERVVKSKGQCTTQAIGIMLASFPAPTHTTAFGIADLQEKIEKKGGSLAILQYGSLTWSNLKNIEPAKAVSDLMQSIKHQFDPQNTLNPGARNPTLT
jgi:glycolate oxidase FAD binding subunit